MDSYDGNGLLLSRESNLLLENGELRRMNDTEEKKRKGDDFLLQEMCIRDSFSPPSPIKKTMATASDPSVT